MGYNTRYTISLSGQSSEEENNEILATQIYDGLTVARFVDGDVDEMKWYDHENDMTALSIKYPHVTFTLEGCGEEMPDLWKKYFLGGQMQREMTLALVLGLPDPPPHAGHPNCRCSLTTVLPGYGFDSAGMLTYVGKDHDEYVNQRK